MAATVSLVASFLLFAATAHADTLTVDDDRSECPRADFTSLTEAVAAAPQGSTIKICAGTYLVPGGAQSSGLRIDKNLKLHGAGADKVFVQPDGTSPSIAGANPNPRDEYGNVITVRRRTIQLFSVEISGLTVRAAGTAIEGGISMIDVNEGRISGVKVEGFVPEDGPGSGAYESPEMIGQGQGIILANTIESTQNEVWVSGTEISGFNSAGVLVDNRLLNGAGWVSNNSRMIAHLDSVEITGSGDESVIPQNGVEVWTEGASVDLQNSSIYGTGRAPGAGEQVPGAAVMLRGAKTAETAIGGTAATSNDLSGNDFGIANLSYDGTSPGTGAPEARRNYFGPLGPGASAFVATGDVTWRPAASVKPAAPELDAVLDEAPSIEWDDAPAEGDVLPIGEPVPLAVVAGDDFGVNSVDLTIDGESLGEVTVPGVSDAPVWESVWTPTVEDAGKPFVIGASAVDSSGQVTAISVNVSVAALPTCEEDPTQPGCEEPPTCETDPTLPSCPQPPTCETDPTLPSCPQPPTCETDPTLPGCSPQPPAAGILMPAKPTAVAVKRGRKAMVRIRVRNTGDAALTGVKVCPTIGKRAKRMFKPVRCVKLGAIQAGKAKIAKIVVSPKAKAKKGKFTFAFKVNASGVKAKTVKGVIRVKG